MDFVPEIFDADAHCLRKLGSLCQPAGFATCFAAYADAGHPMFSMDEIRKFGKENDATGRSKFDATFIKDQKSHGSCNGFAGASALSRARIRRGLPRVDLSGAYLYSLINGGRDQGSLLEDGMKVVQTNGVATEATVGWDAIYPSKQPSTAKAEALRYRAFECYSVKTEAELFSGLMAGFDAVVAVDVDNSFMKLNADGIAGGGRGAGNHAVCVDGFKVLSNGQLCADNPGSWNTSYGDDGRAFLTWDKHFANTVNNHTFYLIRSAIDDPNGTNPPAIN